MLSGYVCVHSQSCWCSYVLQKLQQSLEATYGQVYKAENSEDVFEKFFEWKNAKQEEFNRARNATDASLQNLVKCFRGIIKVKTTSSILQKNSRELGVPMALLDVILLFSCSVPVLSGKESFSEWKSFSVYGKSSWDPALSGLMCVFCLNPIVSCGVL